MKNNSTHIPEIAQKKVLDEPLCEISEIAENGADKVLCKSEKNSSVHRKYVNFSSAQERALDEPLYAISAGRAFFRRMLQMRRNFLTPCTLIRTQGKKLQADMALCGRSMVEMLGVLAIIGVLSVSAIAGYSKAMMKHKLNKHRETYSFLLNNAIQLSANLPKSTSIAALKYTHVLHKLNLIPDGMTYHDQSSSIEEKGIIKDIFQNEITLLSSKGYGYEWSLSSSIPNTSYSFDICVNLVAVAQAYPRASDFFARSRGSNLADL